MTTRQEGGGQAIQACRLGSPFRKCLRRSRPSWGRDDASEQTLCRLPRPSLPPSLLSSLDAKQASAVPLVVVRHVVPAVEGPFLPSRLRARHALSFAQVARVTGTARKRSVLGWVGRVRTGERGSQAGIDSVFRLRQDR